MCEPDLWTVRCLAHFADPNNADDANTCVGLAATGSKLSILAPGGFTPTRGMLDSLVQKGLPSAFALTMLRYIATAPAATDSRAICSSLAPSDD